MNYSEEDLRILRMLLWEVPHYYPECLRALDLYIRNLPYKDYINFINNQTITVITKEAYDEGWICFYCKLDEIPLHMSSHYDIVQNIVRWRLQIGK